MFDGGGEFKDCGTDNCCDSDNNCDDIGGDNYNIDPNNDNYGIDSILTEGNSILDWEDKNEDGVWNLGEGEQWFDWGIDQLPDSLELFQQSSILPINIYENNYIYDINNEFFQYQPNLIDTNLNLWISSIKKINSTNYSLEISIQNNIPISGLQFKLSHLPYIKTDTIVQINNIDLVQFGTDKIFKDFSLLPREEYNQEDFNEKLFINYSNDIYSILDFDSLDFFLSIQENIISNEYSKMILYVDTLDTKVNSEMWVYLTHPNNDGIDQLLLSQKITLLSDSIIIPIGPVLRNLQNNLLTYEKFKLIASGTANNYSILSIFNNAQLNVLYQR